MTNRVRRVATLPLRGVRLLAGYPRRLSLRHWVPRKASFVISYPKAGRTWLRLMIASAISQATGSKLSLTLADQADPSRGIPFLVFTHDGAGLTHSRPLATDKRQYRGKTVLLLVRNPRDIVVSHYFQATLRKRRRPQVPSLDAFIRGPLGIDRVLTFMNAWASSRDVPARFHLVRYEDFHRDALARLRECVDFLQIQDLSDAHLAAAVEMARYERMRELESTGALADPRLSPGDPDDPESFKVRRGKVGGYVDYLSDEQVAFLNARIRTSMDPLFAYYYDA